MLKSTAPFITKSLTKLFNKSLRSGKFPSDWKVAPIPKGGDLENPANYRPISILPILSKLLEKHLHDLLSHHLKIFSPLSEHQWGFTSGKSTTSALISYAHDINDCQEALDCGNELCSVFFDLSKAFDTVPHQPLLSKLFQLQVDPFIIRWVSNYLSDRTQSVVLGGVQSKALYL